MGFEFVSFYCVSYFWIAFLFSLYLLLKNILQGYHNLVYDAESENETMECVNLSKVLTKRYICDALAKHLMR